MTHQFNIAPPVRKKSVRFMAASIETIEISDIPKAVFNAIDKTICLERIRVSSIIEVIRPLSMASTIIQNTGQSMPDN